MNKPRLMIAGTGSGSGKTTLTCALLKHFYEQDIKVTAFKSGPDYIDPMFHLEVLHTPSYNLDLYMMGKENCTYLLDKHTRNTELALIEGVMGFYDGMGQTTSSSSYELASVTKTPVVLVVSCKGMGLSIVPLIEGFLNFKENTIKGVILNGINKMSYTYYKEMIEKYTSIKVYGYLPYIEEASLESRHLGLITAKEVEDLEAKIHCLYEQTKDTLDIEGLLNLSKEAENLESPMPSEIAKLFDENIKSAGSEAKVKIGIAKDQAFAFYYQDNLELLEALGAELIPFSPLEDRSLPVGIKGLILGGGYPEVYAKSLEHNGPMKEAIKQALEDGMPCIAECGGFIYLQKSLELMDGTKHNMVGFLNGEVTMTKNLVRFGYVEMESLRDTVLTRVGEKLKVHEFHYSDCTQNGEAFKASKASKSLEWLCIEGKENLFAGYPHIHFYTNPQMAKRFVATCKMYKSDRIIKYLLPNDIEKESFRMIDEILGETKINPLYAPIIKRAIHTTADFDYATHLCFSDHVVERAILALQKGAHIVTDTQMVKAGINKTIVASFGGEVHCFVADEDVALCAKERGTTRSAVAMEKAMTLKHPLIFAIGNAPTALLKIKELVEKDLLNPELVIGVPVGFVNVVESKEELMEIDVPYIVARGRKGGSNVAAAICNALLYMASNRQI